MKKILFLILLLASSAEAQVTQRFEKVVITSSAADALRVTGQVTASQFNGPLVGNVTGNVTGNLTGLASSATKLVPGRTINGIFFDGTADITVSDPNEVLTFGAHLTGTSYDGSVPVTIATDAVSINTAGTLVARDGSGNFAAGTVSATVSAPDGTLLLPSVAFQSEPSLGLWRFGAGTLGATGGLVVNGAINLKDFGTGWFVSPTSYRPHTTTGNTVIFASGREFNITGTGFGSELMPMEVWRDAQAVTPNNGAAIRNSTASTLAIPVQISPRYLMSGTGWDTNDTVSRTVDYFTQVLPSSGTTVGGQWQLGYVDPVASTISYPLQADINGVYLRNPNVNNGTSADTQMYLNLVVQNWGTPGGSYIYSRGTASPTQAPMTLSGWTRDGSAIGALEFTGAYANTANGLNGFPHNWRLIQMRGESGVSATEQLRWTLWGSGRVDQYVRLFDAAVGDNSPLGTVSTDGHVLNNPVASTVGVPVQMSPRVRLAGSAWDTDDAVNRAVSYFTEVLPSSGTTVGGQFKIGYIDPVTAAISYPVVVTSDGKVGIGTLAPSNNTLVHLKKDSATATQGPHITLENTNTLGVSFISIGEDTIFTAKTGGIEYINSGQTNTNFATTPNAFRFFSSTGATGGLQFNTSANAPIVFVTGGFNFANERMRILGTGQVGIGTTGPNAPLEVVHTAGGPSQILRSSTSTGYADLRIYNDQNSGARSLEIAYTGSAYASNFFSSAPAGELGAIGTSGAFSLVLGTSNTNRLLVSSTGNVGIGTGTTLPTGKFDVQSTGNSTFVIRGLHSAGTNVLGALTQNSSGGGDFQLRNSANGLQTLLAGDGDSYINAISGAVGIGTSGPSALLHIDKSQNAPTSLYTTNSNAGGAASAFVLVGQSGVGGNYGSLSHKGSGFTSNGLYVADRTVLEADDTAGLLIATYPNAPIIFGTNLNASSSNERMQIDGTGLVSLSGASGLFQLTEVTAPAAGAANTVRIYAVDDGAGKTKVCALFNTGVAQCFAQQP